MPVTLLKNLVCPDTLTIEQAFARFDNERSDVLFVADAVGHLTGWITKTDLRQKLLAGASAADGIKTAIVKDAPYIGNTDTDNEKDLRVKLDFLKNKFKLAPDSPVAVCDDELKVLQVVTWESLWQAGERRVETISSLNNRNDINNVCIIGGAGYLGSVLTKQLLTAGYNVTVFDNFIFGQEPIKQVAVGLTDQRNAGKLTVVAGDARNISDLTKCLVGMDAVVMLAAVVGDPAASKYPVTAFEVNYLSALTAVQVCAHFNINRFLFASTCSVYGQSAGGAPLDEQAPLNPVSHYARTKIAAEREILKISSQNFAPTILRMSTLYGPSPRMRYDLVVNTMMMRGITTGKITLFGGKQWRPLLSVADAAAAYVKVLEADIHKIKGQVYNVGEETENYQIENLAFLVADYLRARGIKVEIEQAVGGDDARDYRVSFQKIKNDLGFKINNTVPAVLGSLFAVIQERFSSAASDHTYYNDKNVFGSDARSQTVDNLI